VGLDESFRGMVKAISRLSFNDKKRLVSIDFKD
jgi:hypothetical protein